MAGGRKDGAVFESHCSLCDVTARWRLVSDTDRSQEWQALSGSSFPCEHWPDHQEATRQAADAQGRRAQVGTVTAAAGEVGVRFAVVCCNELGEPCVALGPADAEADAGAVKDALRLPHGWTVKIVPLRQPDLVDVRAQVQARRGDPRNRL